MEDLRGAVLCLSFYLPVKSINCHLYIYHLLPINHYVVCLLGNTYNLIFFRINKNHIFSALDSVSDQMSRV